MNSIIDEAHIEEGLETYDPANLAGAAAYGAAVALLAVTGAENELVPTVRGDDPDDLNWCVENMAGFVLQNNVETPESLHRHMVFEGMSDRSADGWPDLPDMHKLALTVFCQTALTTGRVIEAAQKQRRDELERLAQAANQKPVDVKDTIFEQAEDFYAQDKDRVAALALMDDVAKQQAAVDLIESDEVDPVETAPVEGIALGAVVAEPVAEATDDNATVTENDAPNISEALSAKKRRNAAKDE